MKSEKISVVVATYNGAQYLSQQIDSIISQTLKPFEIIVVDDCSVDETVNILKKYTSLYSFIKIYHNKENIGACQTFSKALSLVNGEYIALSDQDDVWLPNKLEMLLEHIGNNILIHSDAYIVDESLNTITNTFVKGVMNQETFIDYLFANNVNGNTCLFKRNLLDYALPIPAKFYGHDHYLAIIARYLGDIKYIDIPLIQYRQHGKNLFGVNLKVSFDKFLLARKRVEVSLRTLLLLQSFKQNDVAVIELVADYHNSIYLGKWQSKYSKFKILKFPRGWRYFIAYFILTGFGSHYVAKQLYNLLKK